MRTRSVWKEPICKCELSSVGTNPPMTPSTVWLVRPSEGSASPEASFAYFGRADVVEQVLKA
jgi:hypothetical protein